MNFQDEKDEKKKDEKKRGKENGPEASDIAAHRQGHRVVTLHMGNGWVTQPNPVYVQVSCLLLLLKSAKKRGANAGCVEKSSPFV